MPELKKTSLPALHAFVLEHLDSASVGKRVLLMRTLAEVIGDARDAAALNNMADELESVARRHSARQMQMRAILEGCRNQGGAS
jgi:hypothetical protein